MIDEANFENNVRSIIKEYLKGSGFTDRKLTDTPIDAFQVVNKKYCDANVTLTALTGDITGTGTGSILTTLATVNGNVGTFGSATQIPVFTVNGKGLITAASNANFNVTSVSVPILSGESLNVGEVVCIKLGTGNNTTQGYQWVNGTAYAVRAAANDTTYGNNVLGMVSTGAAYLGTAQIALAGDMTGLTGLTVGSKHYLDNYSAASSNTFSQATQDANVAVNTNVFTQAITMTESRFDKIILYLKRNGGGGTGVSVSLKRQNTTLETLTVSPPNDNTFAEQTFDFTDIRVYKGETLSLSITSDDAGTNSLYFAYKSGGSVYNGTLSGTGIAAGSDLYFKAYEFTNFGKLNVTPGTRKFKMGQALSATELAESMQELDSQL